MAEDDLSRRREALRTRLDKYEVETEERERKENTTSMAGYAVAFRLSTEFIAGIVAGGVIGFALDWLFGTTPWLFIVFLLLGFVAGILNVLRSAGLIQTPQVGKRPHGSAEGPGR